MYAQLGSEKHCAAITKIVAAMCAAGHMSGWFGDTSQDFQDEQARNLINMRKYDRIVWLDNNANNLMRDCGIDHDTIMHAMG